MLETFTPYYMIFATLVWGLVGIYILFLGKKIYFSHKAASQMDKDAQYFHDLKNISLDNRFGKKIHALMGANMANPNFTPVQLARELRCSLPELHSITSKLLHQSPEEYIVSVRMKKAAFLLKYNFGTLEEVAKIVGYTHLPIFSRTFRRYYGMAPKEYMDLYKNHPHKREFSF
jgi:AraC-like DNA-binding protein